MSSLRRIVMIRHGETEGRSSIRFHGSGDTPLSDEGRTQLRESTRALRTEVFDIVVASTLRRSWEGAAIVSGGAPVRLEPNFREVHFGRWEGLTLEEIEASDPALFQDWKSGADRFEYPGGEPRADFKARIQRGLDRLMESGAASALIVSHKGVIRNLSENLLGENLSAELPLGGIASLSLGSDGTWREGRRGSNPPGLTES
jgi:broad specificity phosphatase PhoE